MALAEVTTLFDANCRSIPAMLREAADSIEAETDSDDRTKAIVAVHVSKSGEVMVYGWGDTDDFHALGSLTAGIAELNANMRGDD